MRQATKKESDEVWQSNMPIVIWGEFLKNIMRKFTEIIPVAVSSFQRTEIIMKPIKMLDRGKEWGRTVNDE